jgi:hypothetical protein
MRWLGIRKTLDGEIDKYAVAYATHTVAMVTVYGHDLFEAWRLTGTQPGEAILLGRKKTPAAAKLLCELDARGEGDKDTDEDAA